MTKTPAQLKQDIGRFIAGGGIYYPGGDGGGGSSERRRSRVGAVAKPHARTSPACRTCGRFHTLGDHAAHGEPLRAKTKKTTRTRSARRPSRAKKTKTKKTKKKTTPKKARKARARSARSSGTREVTLRDRSRGSVWLKIRDGRVVGAMGSEPARYMGLSLGEARRLARYGGASPSFLGLGARSRAPSASASRDPLPVVLSAVKTMPPSGRFGPDKVYISDVFGKVGKKIKMTMGEFKRWLVVQNRERHLNLARADLPDAMDRAKVDRSEIRDMGATFHFILDPTANEFGPLP